MVGLIKIWPAMAAVALLAGCDGGASAVPVHQATATAPPSGGGAAFPGRTVAAEARAAPAGRAEGRLAWSSNRRFTSGQNAERNFRRNGAAFGAASLGDYVAKAHAFIARPPRGAQTLTRANGDTLIYDPASNVFAVATREGLPRTMFKPDEGPAYWESVKAREANGGARRKREED
jgi:pyocin large subunit-like protein